VFVHPIEADDDEIFYDMSFHLHACMKHHVAKALKVTSMHRYFLPILIPIIPVTVNSDRAMQRCRR